MKLNLQKLSINTSSYGAWMGADDEGDLYYVKDVEALLKKIGYLTNLNLRNDSHRHNMVFKGINITYRLSVKKSHFWIYNKDTGQEIQYISHDSEFPNLHENWESFMEDFWNYILEDMR